MLAADRDGLVGRFAELADLGRLLTERVQLVTITGPGGVGKTRVARRVAADLRGRRMFRDGVVLVDLHGVDDPDWVADLVVHDAGLQDVSDGVDGAGVLRRRLRHADLLLVLDHCDQVVAEVADLVGALLDHCPGLRVLATSRVAMDLPGEHQFPLLPLAAPHPDSPVHRGVDLPAALVLFAERAAAVDPTFDLAAHRRSVARICHRLGGNPLLIEIVTAKLRMFSVAQLEERLDDVFGSAGAALTRTGHRTTSRGVMDLAWKLCSPAERLVWQRMSVFTGGATREAAEAVACGVGVEPEDVGPLLDGLVRRSLLTRDDAPEQPRFRMLEPIRQVGSAALAATGEQDAIRERHSAWCERYVVRAAREWCGPREVAWLDAVHADLPNVRTALAWCATSGNAARGIRIVSELIRLRLPFRDGTMREWRGHLQRMLDLYPRRDRLRAVGLAQCAWVAVCQGSPDAAGLLERARAVLDEEHPLVAFVEVVHAALTRGDAADIDAAVTARKLLREHGGPDGDVAMATMWIAIAAALLGDDETADRFTRMHLDEATAFGGTWFLSWAQWIRAAYLLRRGDLDGAAALLAVSLPAQRAIGDFWGPVWWMAVAAWLASAGGEHLRAAELTGVTDRVVELTGIPLDRVRGTGEQHRRCRDRAAAALGEREFGAAYERGRAVRDRATAVALVLGETRLGEEPPEPEGAGRSLLTRREHEVALLVAERTNDEIAAALGVSVATVKTHVTQILQKLGCSGRRQVPDALVRHGLVDGPNTRGQGS